MRTTARLTTGTEVEVWAVDPSGYVAVRHPEHPDSGFMMRRQYRSGVRS